LPFRCSRAVSNAKGRRLTPAPHCSPR